MDDGKSPRAKGNVCDDRRYTYKGHVTILSVWTSDDTTWGHPEGEQRELERSRTARGRSARRPAVRAAQERGGGASREHGGSLRHNTVKQPDSRPFTEPRVPSAFSDHSGVKLQIGTRKRSRGFPNIWTPNNTLPKPGVKAIFSRELRKCIESNAEENTEVKCTGRSSSSTWTRRKFSNQSSKLVTLGN